MSDDTNNMAERLAKMPQEWWQKVARAATEGYGFKLGTVEASRAVKKAAAELAPLLAQVPGLLAPAVPVVEAGEAEFDKWWIGQFGSLPETKAERDEPSTFAVAQDAWNASRARLRELAAEWRHLFLRPVTPEMSAWRSSERMKGIVAEIMDLLSPAAPSAQAKSTGEGEKVRELRAEFLGMRDKADDLRMVQGRDEYDRGYFHGRANAFDSARMSVERLFPGVVAEGVGK